jgi:hypothetical protein
LAILRVENDPHLALSKGKSIVAQKSEIKNKIKTYDFQENFLPSYHIKKNSTHGYFKGGKIIHTFRFQKEKV